MASNENNKDTFEAKLDEIGDYITVCPWELDRSGVYQMKTARNGKGEYKEVASPIPVVPTAILENVDTRTEKVELAFFKHGAWRSLVADRSITASRNNIVRLADKGLEVNTDNAALLVKYIAEVVASSLPTMPHKPAKSVLGWVDGEFMPYTDAVAFDGEDQFKHLYKAVAQKGKLSEWVEFMRPLRKNLELRLCMAASFASPLIEVVGENPFVFHLWGGTGAGKTVALMVAMSIWGNPAMGAMTRTMNMTANSMLSTAAFLRNLPFAGDELQTIKSRWNNYDNLIMCITEGIDRGRMSYDKVNELRSWKCSFLFSGEEPCIKQSSGGGAKNRVIEVECKDRLVESGNAVANFVRSNYGTAGCNFIDYIKWADLSQLYSDTFSSILSQTDTTDKQAGAMALMMAADCIASGLFWSEEPVLTVSDVQPYLCSAVEVDVAERAYSYVLGEIAKNNAKFSDNDREVWGRISVDTVLINRGVLDDIMTSKGFEFDAVKSKWRDKGYLIPNSQGKLVHWTHCSGIKAIYIKLKLPVSEEEAKQELPFV